MARGGLTAGNRPTPPAPGTGWSSARSAPAGSAAALPWRSSTEPGSCPHPGTAAPPQATVPLLPGDGQREGSAQPRAALRQPQVPPQLTWPGCGSSASGAALLLLLISLWVCSTAASRSDFFSRALLSCACTTATLCRSSSFMDMKRCSCSCSWKGNDNRQ